MRSFKGGMGKSTAALAAVLFFANASGFQIPPRSPAVAEALTNDRPAPVAPQRARLLRLDKLEHAHEIQTAGAARRSSIPHEIVLALLALCVALWLALRGRTFTETI